MTIQLKVGRRYRDRNGDVWVIKGRIDNAPTYPFRGQRERDGMEVSFISSGQPYGISADIIEELPETDTVRPEVGKCYRTRDGRKAYVECYNETYNWPFYGRAQGTPRRWSREGRGGNADANALDLVAPWVGETGAGECSKYRNKRNFAGAGGLATPDTLATVTLRVPVAEVANVENMYGEAIQSVRYERGEA